MPLTPLEQAAMAAYTPEVAAGVGQTLSSLYPKGIGYDAPGTGPAYDENMVFRFNSGNKIQVPDGKGGWITRNAAPVVFQPGKTYVLADPGGKTELGRASTPEELQKLIALSDKRGGKGWDLFEANSSGKITPGTQLFGRPASDNLPLYLIGGGLAAITGAAALGLGAAGGGGAAGAAGGGGAASAGGLGGAAGAAGGGAAGVGGAAGGLGSALGAGIPTTIGTGITVTAPVAGGLGLGGAGAIGAGVGGIGAATGGLGGGGAGSGAVTADPKPIEVVGSVKPPITVPPITIPAVGAGVGAATGGLGGGGGGPATTDTNPIEVVGNTKPPITVPPVVTPPLTTPGTATGGTETTGTDPIEVTGGKSPKPPITGVPIDLPPVTVPPVNIPPVDVPKIPAKGGKPSLGDILDWVRGGALVGGLVGDLFGGGGNGGGGGAGAFGQHSSMFTDGGLGPATIPGLAPGTGGARDMSGTDWAHYGEGPEQSFFNYVPKGPKKLARGGPLSHISGPGDGREDKIPAMLSDGEYVVDAETVALLGNGSNKAGAQKLDQLRVKIRKQKGKALAKGGFSSDAKHPEAYLAGGRV